MPQKKKVAVVVQKYGLVGGGEKFVAELTERLACDQELEIHVLAHQWKPSASQISFHRIPMVSFPRWLKPITFAAAVRRRLTALKVDVVHTHERIYEADIYSVHGTPHRFWVKKVRRKAMNLYDRALAHIEDRLMSAHTDGPQLLAVSSLVQEKMIQSYPHCRNRIEIVHPGVDAQAYQSLDRADCRRMLMNRCGFDTKDLILLFVGMNFEVKGLGPIINGLAHAINQGIADRWRLVVVGKGNHDRYQRMANQMGIGNRMAFWGVEEQQMAKLYLAADAFVMLSSFDTFGLTVLEAMAAGLPVMISPWVGAQDVVTNGTTGFIVDPGQTDQVSQTLGLLADDELRQQMGSAAQEQAARYSWDATAMAVKAQYLRFWT